MTLVQLFTAIANAIRGKTGSSNSIPAENFPNEISNITTGNLTDEEYEEAQDDLDDILENTTLPSGTISITENGIHDVTNYASANVNVVSEYNVKMKSKFDGYDNVKKNILSIPPIDVSGSSDLNQAFYDFIRLENISIINMNSSLNLTETFSNCSSLKILSISGTGKPYGMPLMCYNCANLIDIPLLDTSNVSNMNSCFGACPSLSNESLNKILLMCANTTSRYGYDKTLKKIGLSSTQATTCQGLSNWQTFLDAGWTTGY